MCHASITVRIWIWSCAPTAQNDCFSSSGLCCRLHFKLCITVRFSRDYKSNSGVAHSNIRLCTCISYCAFQSDLLPFWDPQGHAAAGGPRLFSPLLSVFVIPVHVEHSDNRHIFLPLVLAFSVPPLSHTNLLHCTHNLYCTLSPSPSSTLLLC